MSRGEEDGLLGGPLCAVESGGLSRNEEVSMRGVEGLNLRPRANHCQLLIGRLRSCLGRVGCANNTNYLCRKEATQCSVCFAVNDVVSCSVKRA